MGTLSLEQVLILATAALQDAPYLLEPVVGTFVAEEVPVRLALLSAAAKLFFKRPPECQKLLGKALAAAAADSNQDVHDRALLYYRWGMVQPCRPSDEEWCCMPVYRANMPCLLWQLASLSCSGAWQCHCLQLWVSHAVLIKVLQCGASSPAVLQFHAEPVVALLLGGWHAGRFSRRQRKLFMSRHLILTLPA